MCCACRVGVGVGGGSHKAPPLLSSASSATLQYFSWLIAVGNREEKGRISKKEQGMGEAENNALQSGRRRTMIVAHGEEEEEDVAAVVAIKGEGEEELSRSLDRPTPPTPQQPLSVGLLSVQGNPGWFRVGGRGGWVEGSVCVQACQTRRSREGDDEAVSHTKRGKEERG